MENTPKPWHPGRINEAADALMHEVQTLQKEAHKAARSAHEMEHALGLQLVETQKFTQSLQEIERTWKAREAALETENCRLVNLVLALGGNEKVFKSALENNANLTFDINTKLTLANNSNDTYTESNTLQNIEQNMPEIMNETEKNSALDGKLRKRTSLADQSIAMPNKKVDSKVQKDNVNITLKPPPHIVRMSSPSLFGALINKPQSKSNHKQVDSKQPVSFKLRDTFTHKTVVCCVKISPCAKLLASGSSSLALVFILNSKTPPKQLKHQDTGNWYVRSLVFSADSLKLATGCEDKSVRVWNIATQTIIWVAECGADVYAIAWTPNYILSAGGNRLVSLWEPVTGRLFSTLDHQRITISESNLIVIDPKDEPEAGGANGVTSVCTNQLSTQIITGSIDTNVRIWTIIYNSKTAGYSNSLDSILKSHTHPIYSVAYSSDSTKIASGSLDGTVCIWNVPPSKSESEKIRIWDSPIRILKGHDDFVLSVVFPGQSYSGCLPPGMDLVLSGGKDKRVIVWDLENDSDDPRVGEIGNHGDSVICVCCDFGMNIVATACGDMSARVFEVIRE